MTQDKRATGILAASHAGDQEATEELVTLLYSQLRALAGSFLRAERQDHTLQPTALVHEAYLRLVDLREVAWRGRAHFFSVGAEVMRRVLVDHSRRHGAAKRGGGRGRVDLEDADPGLGDGVDLLVLDDALRRLGELNERQARIVELRYFGGLTIDETAEALEVSPATVKAEWAMARVWLREKLAP